MTQLDNDFVYDDSDVSNVGGGGERGEERGEEERIENNFGPII